MKSGVHIVAITILSTILAGCAGLSPEQLAKIEFECQQKEKSSEFYNYFFSEGECIATYRTQTGYLNDKVIVFLHGSMSNNQSSHPLLSEYNQNRVDYLQEETGITTYMITYPGYKDSSSNRYKRYNSGNRADFWSAEYSMLIAGVLEQIKEKEKAKELYVFGHSLGARIGGTILGLQPGLINKLAAYGGRFSTSHLGTPAMDIVDKVDKNSSVLLLVGGEDFRISYSKEYHRALQQQGIQSLLEIVEGQGHSINTDNYKIIYSYVTDFFILGKIR